MLEDNNPNETNPNEANVNPDPAAGAPNSAAPTNENPKEILSLEEYMQRVCAGSIDLKKNPNVEQRATALSRLLREKLGAHINMSEEREAIRDMRVYDQRTDKIVSFLALTDLPEYFNIDYPSLNDISRLLMDGHTIFFPQRNIQGEVDRNNPMMLCGGEVDGKFHLQIHDKQTQETMKHLDTTVQKPGFLDWVADLFRRVFTKTRDPICEVWEKYAPLRKISSKQKALNTEDHLYYAQKKLDAMEVKDEVLVEALNRQVQQEKMLSDASKNILSVSTEGKVSEFQQSVCDHIRKLELDGVGEYIGGTRDVAHKDTPFIYNLHQAPVVYGAKREGMPGLSMYGTVIAFALADQLQELKGKPLNQVAMHALLSGNYKALETMPPYGELVEPLKDAMAKLSVLRVTVPGGEYNETSWLKNLKSDARSYQTGMLEIGLRRMQSELLQQQNLTDAWSLEMGRILEAAELIIHTPGEKLGPLEERFARVDFTMLADAKLICNRQAVVERGIGAEVGSEDYKMAQDAIRDLEKATEMDDFTTLLTAGTRMDFDYRRKLEANEELAKEDSKLWNGISTFAEPFLTDLNEECEAGDHSIYVAHDESLPMTVNELTVMTSAVVLAEKYKLTGEDMRKIFNGDKTDLPDGFREELQTMVNDRDVNHMRTTFNAAMKWLDRELQSQQDLSTPWSRFLAHTSELADEYHYENSHLCHVGLYRGLRPNSENGVTVPIENGGQFGALLHDLLEYARPNESVSSISRYEQMTDLHAASEGVVRHLQTALLKTLADGYVEKLNQQKTPEKRLTFLVKNERVLNALFSDAEAFVRENREKYAESAEVFKKAIRGGIIKDFNKYMMERQMDIAKQNTGKAKQALADSLTRTEQQPKKEAPVIGGGLK